MSHLPELIRDLALILITASAVSLLFRFLKQPVILGYMAAGLLVGPSMHFFPLLSDPGAIQTWADIGVIFMLFTLGIEFSFKKLMQVGGTALIAGLFEISCMALSGTVLGLLFGWRPLPSLFLGTMVAISSTSIILKSFEEAKVKAKKFASIVYAILIVEDMVAVLFIVLLTTLSISRNFQGMELILTSLKLVFYLALWLMVGLWVIPWALKALKKYLTDETTLVVSVGLCLAMVVAAVEAGFSAALGAFVMGSILAETTEKERIEKLLLPVKDLFSAIFFVSVGMLMNPQTLIENPLMVLLIALVVIIGKIFFVTTGALLSGQPVRTSIFAGLSLAQIGEFSFILASLGYSLHVTGEGLSSTIVAVSVVATFITPYLLRHRESLANVIEKIIPKKFQFFIRQYLQVSAMVKASSEWKSLLRAYCLKIFLNAIVIICIFIFTSRLLLPYLLAHALLNESTLVAVLAVTLILCLPFFWGIIFAKSHEPRLANLIQTQFSHRFRKGLLFSRLVLALLLLGGLVAQFLSFRFAFFISLGLFALLFLSLSRFVGPIYIWFENRFLHQIKENATNLERHASLQMTSLTPWEAHMSEYVIPPEASFAGQDLLTLRLGEKFGVIVARIQRGSRLLLAPGRHETLMPFDRVSVIGSDEQLEKFEEFLESSSQVGFESPSPNTYTLEQHLVTDHSPFMNKAIKDSRVRELTRGLIVGIERGDNRILSPDSNTMILQGDLLWLVGDRMLIRAL
jgi:CPA2 family monovalent cation:H+ antiporter-2